MATFTFKQPIRQRHECLDFQRLGPDVGLQAEFRKHTVDRLTIQSAFEVRTEDHSQVLAALREDPADQFVEERSIGD